MFEVYLLSQGLFCHDVTKLFGHAVVGCFCDVIGFRVLFQLFAFVLNSRELGDLALLCCT
jgi:hypothetical protein